MVAMDQVFKRDFREMIRFRNLHAIKIKLYDIPLLDEEIKQDMSKLVYVKGIDCDYYNKLNNTYAFIVNKREMNKRQLLSDGSFRKDEKGSYVYDIVRVPSSSLLLASTVNIRLKTGVKEEGFGYIDYVDMDGKRYYYYIIPRKYVYKTNVLALVVSNTRRKIFYKGYKMSCQDGVDRYLYIIPYKNINRSDTRVVKLFVGDHALEKSIGYMVAYLRFLEHMNIIFNIGLSFLEDGENLTLKEYDGTIDSYDFLGYSFDKVEDEEEVF